MVSICLSDKQGRAGQGRAGAVTLAFPSCYLLAAQGRVRRAGAGAGQGRAGRPGQTPAH
jgi:hypothetical protein